MSFKSDHISLVLCYENFWKSIKCSYISGPTVCYYGINHFDVTPISARNAEDNTPVLFEASPSNDEEIVEIEVSNMPNNEVPEILTPTEVRWIHCDNKYTSFALVHWVTTFIFLVSYEKNLWKSSRYSQMKHFRLDKVKINGWTKWRWKIAN